MTRQQALNAEARGEGWQTMNEWLAVLLGTIIYCSFWLILNRRNRRK